MAFSGKDGGGDAPRTGGRGDAALTIIATGTRVVGEVHSNGVVKVEGEIEGTVRAERQVLVAKGGRIDGDVVTREAVIGGEVTGSVTGEERVEVQTGSVVNGDIITERLIVQEGGEVNGQVKMGTVSELSAPSSGPAMVGESSHAQAARPAAG